MERKTEKCSAALRDLLRICETVCHGTHAAQGTMQPFSVIEKLYETVQIRLHLPYCSIFSLKCQSIFEGCKKNSTQEMSYGHPGVLRDSSMQARK